MRAAAWLAGCLTGWLYVGVLGGGVRMAQGWPGITQVLEQSVQVAKDGAVLAWFVEGPGYHDRQSEGVGSC